MLSNKRNYEGSENWYALYLCIDKNFTVDKAQSCMGIKPYSGLGKSRNMRTSKGTIEMLVLKNQGYSFEYIARKFNISSNAARCRLYFYGKAVNQNETC